MPYILQSQRKLLDVTWEPQDLGELTYCLTKLCVRFAGPNPRYGTWAGILGALAATDRELYRTKIGPYEQRQLELTGDVL